MAGGAAKATSTTGRAVEALLSPISKLPGAALLEAKAAALAGDVSRPFVGLGSAEALRLAPFELGRTAISQLVGDKPLSEMLTENVINEGLAFGLGGVVGKLGAAGRRQKPIEGLDTTQAPQLQLRQLDDLRVQSQPEMLGAIDDHASRLDLAVRNESSTKYVDELISGNSGDINKLFKSGEAGSVTKKRLVTGDEPDVYSTSERWQAEVQKAGLDPTRFTRDVQFPRVIEFSAPRGEVATAADILGDTIPALGPAADVTPRVVKAAERVEKTIATNMQPVGDGWFVTRERDNGMFVMAKKTTGSVGAPAADDTWLMFKTDKPGAFAKPQQQWLNAQVAREKWLVSPDALAQVLAKPGSFVTRMSDVTKDAPVDAYVANARMVGGPGKLGELASKAVPQALKNSEAFQHALEMAREYFAPTNRLLRKSSRGNWVLNMGRLIQDSAETLAYRAMNGQVELKPGLRGLFSQLLNPVGNRGLTEIVREIDKQGLLKEYVDLWRKGISPAKAQEMATQGLIQNATAKAWGEHNSLVEDFFKHVQDSERAAGKEVTTLRDGSGGLLNRQWDGDFLTVLRDETGKVQGVAAGRNKTHSLQQAAVLQEQLRTELGRPIINAGTYNRLQKEGLPKDLGVNLARLSRTNVRGFKFDLETPKADEFLRAINDSLLDRSRYMATNTRQALLSRDVTALSAEDPFALRVVTTKFNQMAGIEGEFSRFQNRIVDSVLAPILGNNSATKIVQATNGAMWHIQLGMLKIGHPITNLMGTLQTVTPEIAFVLGSAPERLAAAYTYVPAVGASGPVGALGFLNPLAILGRAFNEMRKPNVALLQGLERGVNERILDPRMLEDYFGEKRLAAKNIGQYLTDPKEFWRAVTSVSEFLPANSERLARTHAFTSGWIVARDGLGLQGDQLFRFAKQFTERTMYQYASAERPLVFTSPVGSSMGLFKNWMMNYLASFFEYAHEGAVHGNWAPLLWQTAGGLATGGVAATPVYFAANAFSEAFANKNSMQFAYDNFSGKVADGFTFGLPAALLGISTSSQMAVPGADPVRDAAQLFSFAAWTRAKELGKAGGEAIDNWKATGEHPGSDPRFVARMVKALAPVTIYRTMGTWNDDGTVRSLGTDLPQVKGLTKTDIFLYRVGLPPVALERNLKAAEELYQSRQTHNAAIQAFGTAYYQAMSAEDRPKMDRIIQRVLGVGLDVSSVLRSAVGHVKAEEKTTPERLMRKDQKEAWKNVLSPAYD